MNYNNTAKFTFDYTWRDENDEVISRTRQTTTEETLSEILVSFELFLKGSGFVFDGHLDIANELPQEPINMNQQGKLKLSEDRQLEFDFVKELFKQSSEDLDKSDDMDK
jgi:hypothetical protein